MYLLIVRVLGVSKTVHYHNVAQFKPASQSSLLSPNNPASSAIDDSSTTCSRTTEDKGASWTVDLGESYVISHLQISTGKKDSQLLVPCHSSLFFAVSLS